VFLVAVIDVEVLNALVQHLKLEAFTPVKQSAAVPAVDLALVGAIPLWTTRCSTLSLDKGQSLSIRVTRTLQSWQSHIVGEQAHSVDYPLGKFLVPFVMSFDRSTLSWKYQLLSAPRSIMNER
jgi:hypothetical protein